MTLSLTSVRVLSLIEAKNKDIVLRLPVTNSLKAAMPGQYVSFSISSNAEYMTSAFVFVVNTASGFVEIYVPSIEAKKLSIDARVIEIFLSDSEAVNGNAFVLPKALTDAVPREKIKPVLIADEAGLPAIVFLADKIKNHCKMQPLVFLFSNNDFPFTPIPSQFVISNIPMGVLAACPMLEDKKIPSRLLSDIFSPGCYEGGVSDFFDELPLAFFESLKLTLYIAGKKELGDVVENFARKHQLSSQIVNEPIQLRNLG